jgi:hypothetical protein
MCCQNAKNIAAMKEHHDYSNPSMDDAVSTFKISQLAELGNTNDAMLQGLAGMGMGGVNQLFPGPLVNQSNPISQFATENMLKIRQYEQQRQELLMQQQTEIAQLTQIANLSLSRQHHGLLSPLANSNAASTNQGAFTANMIQRNNASSYLALIMAQEKLSSQIGSIGGLQNVSSLDVQRQQANILQAQQQQIDQYSQQRMFQQQAALQQQLQQQLQHLQLQQHLQQQQLQQQAQVQVQCLGMPSSLQSLNQSNTNRDSPPNASRKPNKRTSSAA